jgi:hypothetical protein
MEEDCLKAATRTVKLLTNLQRDFETVVGKPNVRRQFIIDATMKTHPVTDMGKVSTWYIEAIDQVEGLGKGEV